VTEPQPTAVFVVGTRAQLIKMAPVMVACERAGLPVVLLMTGQHRETMDDLLVEFGVTAPRSNVLPPSENASVAALVGWAPQALWGLTRHLRTWRRQSREVEVLVHGDTLSTLLGAVAARMAGARILHVESGLSSGRLFDPFPEEITRRLVFLLTDVAFCPGKVEVERMNRYSCEVIDTGGNTIVDSVHLSGATTRPPPSGERGVLVSLHRFQNLYSGERFDRLMNTVAQLAECRDVHFVLHPATRKRVTASRWTGVFERLPRLSLLPRMGYRDFLCIAADADCVLTDGGSNQEELASLGVPTVIMRETTERLDGLGANVVMERDLPTDVVTWLLAGGSTALRRPPATLHDQGPSERIARWLSGER
jgi:UDP-N-acetylglucosamine 2-epimerase (non-hydrolysing)